MHVVRPRLHARVLGLLLLAAAGLLAVPLQGDEPPAAAREVRALWVTRASLTSAASVAAVVKTAETGGFNTLLLQVRGRGDAYYRSELEPRAAALDGQPASFDPLATALALAKPRKIQVHAWINISLVSSAVDLPSAPTHLVRRHPEWLMVPKPLAREMALIDPKTLLYLEKLTRWSRGQSAEVEGLYASPIPDAAADTIVSVIADLVTRYAVDGVHLDYVRYPTEEFDYSREALAAFREWLLPTLPEVERRRRVQSFGPDLVAWPEAYPDAWRTFRRAKLTNLVSRVRHSVSQRRPTALLSAAVIPDSAEATSRRLQEWPVWTSQRLLDVVCPMAYGTDTATFTAQVSAARSAAGPASVWAGIGAYRISSEQTIENIRIARKLGAAGIALFSYDSLTGPPNGPGYLSQVTRSVFGRTP
jgi:uncharacterized lipoprotein YddW (UPF0748 family)